MHVAEGVEEVDVLHYRLVWGIMYYYFSAWGSRLFWKKKKKKPAWCTHRVWKTFFAKILILYAYLSNFLGKRLMR